MTHEHGPNILDAGAVTIWVAALVGWLPAIASILSIVWLMLRILESRTVQQALGKWRWIKEKNNAGDNEI